MRLIKKINLILCTACLLAMTSLPVYAEEDTSSSDLITYMQAAEEDTSSQTTTEAKDKARLILQNYSVTNDGIVPGENFDLTMTFYNPSEEESIKSVIVTLTNESSVIMPVYGDSDQIYIDEIPAGGTQTVSVTLKAGEVLDVEYVKFGLSLAYADSLSTNNADIITFQIPVTQTSTLEAESVTFPDNAYVGADSRISVTYKNIGTEILYNVNMYVEDTTEQETQQISLGSIGGSKVGYVQKYLDFEQDGDHNLNIWFTYDDASSIEYTSDIFPETINVQQITAKEMSISNIIDESELHQYDNVMEAIILVVLIISAIIGYRLLAQTLKAKR